MDLVSPLELEIQWKDGPTARYAARTLRLVCPCAQCVDEMTGQKILRDETVAEDISIVNGELVGRYGVSFTWSDGHHTGIFTWKFLRQLAGAGEGS